MLEYDGPNLQHKQIDSCISFGQYCMWCMKEKNKRISVIAFYHSHVYTFCSYQPIRTRSFPSPFSKNKKLRIFHYRQVSSIHNKKGNGTLRFCALLMQVLSRLKLDYAFNTFSYSVSYSATLMTVLIKNKLILISAGFMYWYFCLIVCFFAMSKVFLCSVRERVRAQCVMLLFQVKFMCNFFFNRI